MNTHVSFTSSSGSFGEFLEDLAALGVAPVSDGGLPYGLLKARTNDRWWVIPISGGRPSAAAMAMFQPVSLAATIIKAGVTTAARLGVSSGWSAGRLRFGALPNLPGKQPAGLAHCAYFTGTAGPHRKTAIQLMAEDGDILGYAKVSRRPLVKPYLAREAEMLRRIGRLALATADTPAVLAFDPGSAVRPSVLVTDSRKTIGAKSSVRPGGAHLRFLSELASRTRSNGVHRAFESVPSLANETRLPAAWTRRLLSGAARASRFVDRLPVALAHGDFTPWNCIMLEPRLYVFDWEYAADDLPLGYDLVHYLLATGHGADPADVISDLNQRVGALFSDLHPETVRTCVLVSLLLHAAFYLRRQLDYAGSIDGWTDGDRRGRLIDACLHQWWTTAC
ncbi:phosphotransferase [Rhizobium sp. AG855]|uniref:phosphotransferase n=1 Tax=Rhizobium sp. AG855 TaxID=2183898 RepID=UPI000E768468|nr:phosphotransferase [Rhizobium sp. AG855]RKE79224.1 phosphotransferase family enzyme [Rhizobium sp. AG855]